MVSPVRRSARLREKQSRILQNPRALDAFAKARSLRRARSPTSSPIPSPVFVQSDHSSIHEGAPPLSTPAGASPPAPPEDRVLSSSAAVVNTREVIDLSSSSASPGSSPKTAHSSPVLPSPRAGSPSESPYQFSRPSSPDTSASPPLLRCSPSLIGGAGGEAPAGGAGGEAPAGGAGGEAPAGVARGSAPAWRVRKGVRAHPVDVWALDFYQLFGVDRDEIQPVVDAAVRRVLRATAPDAYMQAEGGMDGIDPGWWTEVNDVYGKVTYARGVVTDPERRAKYGNMMRNSEVLPHGCLALDEEAMDAALRMPCGDYMPRKECLMRHVDNRCVLGAAAKAWWMW